MLRETTNPSDRPDPGFKSPEGPHKEVKGGSGGRRKSGGGWATLRRLEPNDLSRIAAIEKEAYGSAVLNIIALRQHLEIGRDVSFAAVANGEVVGYVLAATVSADPREGWVLDLAVVAACRNRGIGRQLMREATNALAAHGAHRIFLTVKPENMIARAVYTSLGFRLSEHDPRYFGPGNPRDILVKDLVASDVAPLDE